MDKAQTPTNSTRKTALVSIVVPRLKGPGGYYNIGNLLGLVGGTVLQIIQAAGDGPIGLSQSIRVTLEQFAGSLSAVALSLAMLVFFWSGEIYHRAWSNGFPPDEKLNRLGDNLSGVGAIFLGIGLLITGQPGLAATAGLLHAVGKFGSAWAGQTDFNSWPPSWPDLWRSLVLASRIPALLAATISLAVEVADNGVGGAAFTPVTLILCTLLWIRADLLLFESKA